MPRPLRQIHDRVSDALAFGILVTGRPQLQRAAFDFIELDLDAVEPAEKAVGKSSEFSLGHDELL